MRFLKAKVLLISLCTLLATDAFAACKTKNTINLQPVHINHNNTRTAYIWLSNVSNKMVDVELQIFDSLGNDVSTTVISGNNPNKSMVGKGTTAYRLLGAGIGGGTVGGRLTWTSADCLKKPLMGNVEFQWSNGAGLIPLQQGKRF